MTKAFTTLLNMSITASYVAIAVIVIRLCLKRMPKAFSYALWLPVFFRLVCPFSFSFSFSLLGLLRPKTETSMGALKYVPSNLGLLEKPAVDLGIKGINNAVNSSLPPAAPLNSANPLQIIIESAAIIWVVGMAILLIYSIVSYLKVINRLRTATLVRENIWETDQTNTPFVCGFIKPKIYIPAGINDKELTYILCHEQIHIKRLDYLIKPAAFLGLIIHWFNPLIWLSFTLMSKDLEMSCDERVIREMGSGIKGSYANSLFSLSARRSGFLTASPLAFGESNIKSRIKNILNYKKPAFWVIAAGIIIIAVLIVGFTANPQNEQLIGKNNYSGYNLEALMANKTPYVGNNSNVVALIDAMPLPEGIVRNQVELQTTKLPYGLTINFIMNDSSGVSEQGAINGDAFYRNSVLLFSLIDNVEIINCKIEDNTGKYDGASYTFIYSREMAEKLVGEDIGSRADSIDALKSFIDYLNRIPLTAVAAKAAQIEQYLDLITSSPKTSSNPEDYLKAHKDEYQNILKMGEEALNYLLAQFEKRTNNNDLRGQIMMSLCKELLGARNNVSDETLPPQEWFERLSIREEVELPDFVYEGSDPIEKLVYETELAQNVNPWRGGFTVVAPKIFGSYQEGSKLKVFVTTYSATYRLYDKVLVKDSAGVIPAAITYTKNADGSYTLEEYKQAMDGTDFAKSIKAYCTMPLSGKKIAGLADAILKHYGNYSDIINLQRENLIKHLKRNNQNGVILKEFNGKSEQLT